jgi:hypothetical protein
MATRNDRRSVLTSAGKNDGWHASGRKLPPVLPDSGCPPKAWVTG